MQILLIDDEPQVIRDMLVMFGYEVDSANDGFEGIQVFTKNYDRYDLIILDLNMPKMDGWSVLKFIRSSGDRPNIPVMMLTANHEELAMISGLRRGADEYLTKPITPGRLLAHIEALMRRSRWEQEAAESMSDPQEEALKGATDLLTQRERELLRYIVQGYSNNQIGDTLSISETTVKNHLANIFKKLHVGNRTQAAFVAQKLKMV
ncbi:MAG: response regulator transcription factor [Cyanobacteria bacterium]|nr:response regulator transcription factor [Cyanobacteriota bacterium]